jgi:hypothetical protein
MLVCGALPFWQDEPLTIENVMSNKVEFSKLYGRPYDEFNCFHIKDFEAGDCIRVNSRSRKGERERGVVESVDYSSNVINYHTADGSICMAIVEDIISLEERRSGWLAEG